MRNKWQKLGLIFNPEIEFKKIDRSCSIVPIVDDIDDNSDIIRIYFTPRDQSNKSEFRYFNFNMINFKVELISEPLFKHGKLGTFDESGVVVCSIVNVNNQKSYYYQGWSLGISVPFLTSIGVAKLHNSSILRIGDGPIMAQALHEPYCCASPTVIFDEDKYKMWYASMDRWEKNGDELKHYYDIKYAESLDGINWHRFSKGVITYQNDSEYAFGRPFVLKEHNIYKMWYCYRGISYRIGYAESIDGINWNRMDSTIDLNVSESGWDSEMIEYPTIFDYRNERYMLYNGNGYGKTGIGLAKLI